MPKVVSICIRSRKCKFGTVEEKQIAKVDEAKQKSGKIAEGLQRSNRRGNVLRRHRISRKMQCKCEKKSLSLIVNKMQDMGSSYQTCEA